MLHIVASSRLIPEINRRKFKLPLPESLDPANTLLFLGSGFSHAATNIANTNPPIGSGLAEEFERQLDVERGELELKVLADEMSFRPGVSLYQTLYRLFTISEISAEQREVLSRRWLRIFTTNYDDAIEFAHQANGLDFRSFNYDDPIPRRIPTGSIVHIHGIIRRTTEENVREQLVLNENSYIKQHFERSPWYGELDRALDHCSACFFIGYSLSDYHIAALLMQKLGRKGKTFFVMDRMPNEIPRRQLEQFGEILPIGLNGFAKLCQELPAPPPITDLHALRSVRYVDPFRDQKSVLPPTPGEILSLVTYGDFNFQRCLTNLPAANYVVPRETTALKVIDELKTAKTVLLHSYLGNGKTVFLSILAYHLSTQGYKSFICISSAPETSREIRALQDQENIVILFDSYDLAIRSISIFDELLPNAKYVVTVRTGVQEVRLHEVRETLPTPLRRVSLNGISSADKAAFKTLLDKAGVLGSHLASEVENSSDFREIVTSIYNHEGIRQRVESDVAPLLADRGTKQVLIAGLLLSWIGQTFEPSLLRTITGHDPYIELRRHTAVASEIFKLDDDNLEVRSPVFAEYLLHAHCSDDDLVDMIEKLLVTSVQRKKERSFGGILSKLMRVAALKSILSEARRLDTVESLFQRLQRDIDINAEPLFWLQYAILANERNEFSQAEGFLETAYKRAKASEKFETYQIDTYALRLLLRIEGRSQTNQVNRFDAIMEKSELVLSMITDQSRRWHAIQVLEDFEPFVRSRAHVMSMTEQSALIFQLNRLERALTDLSVEIQAETGSNLVKQKVMSAKNHILKLAK